MKKPTPRKPSRAKAEPVAKAPAKPKDTISSLRGELTDARYRADQYKQLYYGSINSIERLELTVEALSEALRRERRQEKDIPF